MRYWDIYVWYFHFSLISVSDQSSRVLVFIIKINFRFQPNIYCVLLTLTFCCKFGMQTKLVIINGRGWHLRSWETFRKIKICISLVPLSSIIKINESRLYTAALPSDLWEENQKIKMVGGSSYSDSYFS